MAYLNTNSRTVSTPSNETFQPLGRTATLFGVFAGRVMNAADAQKMGRLQVWIPEFGSVPTEEAGWITVSYCSPFAGATNVETTSKTDYAAFNGTQTSYGMWMVPPDINTQVMVMFINGDPARGIWFGSLYDQFTNNMVPGMAADTDNYQYPGKNIPVAEYNKWNQKTVKGGAATKPYESTKFNGLGNQGLITDPARGITTASARRESPSAVFGILTPGPVIDKNATPENIRRKGGSSFIMDDSEGNEVIQLATKSGAQININETTGFVYLINRDGTAWVQMDKDGNIDIFGATNISMRAQKDINLRADRNINIEAGQNIFMKAAQDTKEETTTFTYDINNVPQPSTIPVWTYVGEGNGDSIGGNIVLQALNNLQSTSHKGTFLSVKENNLEIKIGNTLNVTTDNGGQNFNSKSGIKLTTDASFDLAVTGNIRAGAKGSVSLVGSDSITFCTGGNLSLNAGTDLITASAGSTSMHADTMQLDASIVNMNVLNAEIVNSTTIAIPMMPLGNGAPLPPIPENTNVAEGALSATLARPAEVKPLNDVLNILATWADPVSKFKRNSMPQKTTVSGLPTYEPCPQHSNFSASTVSTAAPILTPDDKTYQGSSGAGNTVTVTPPAAVDVGTNNTSVPGDPLNESIVSKDVNTNALRYQLSVHEGVVDKSYIDTSGLLHGGIGHLMRSNEVPLYPVGTPISADQIDTWYTQDSSSAIKIAQEFMGNTWSDLSDIRKRAIVDLSYNMGKARLGTFTGFISAMKVKDFDRAGVELRNSKWYTQVGRRGPNIVVMVVQNVDPTNANKKFPG